MSHYVIYTPDSDEADHPWGPGWGGSFEWVCECETTSWCRWTCDCDCEEWTVEVAPDGSSAFHTTYDVADDENVQHVMFLDPHGCTIKPWFDESDRDDDLRPGRLGKHKVKVDWTSDYCEFTYTKEAQA